jgi:hypothetical protein
MRKLRNMNQQSVLTDSQKSMTNSQVAFLRKNIYRNIPESSTPQDARPQDARPQDARPQDARPQDARPQDARPQDARPQDARPQDVAYCNFRVRASDLIYARSTKIYALVTNERGDVPGWVLVVLMTTGLVTGIWTMAAPRIEQILRSSLDSMNGIR